jgi:hypothetical protein
MKPSRHLTALLAAGALTVGLGVTVLPGTAGAAPATTRDLTAEKARCTAAIDVRLAALDRVDATLAAARSTTAAHKERQTASNTAAAAGLRDLESTIAVDTDGATLAGHCQSIVEDYRVFALRVPQTHLVIAGDAEAFAVTKLDEVVPRLSDAIDKAAATGKDVHAARAALADLQAELADAAGLANGLADSVIGYTPADYNADHALLDGAHASARAAAGDLKAARDDIKTIVAAVKA